MVLCVKLLYYLLCTWMTLLSVATIGEKAFQACKTYGQSMLECQNILYPQKRVRIPVDLLLFPHMTLIGFKRDTTNTPAWKCGGSLVSEFWVLSAAHCKEDPLDGPASVMRIGTATFEFDEEEGLAQERIIAQILTHPQYKPPSKYHDIALMKAGEHFILDRNIRIACLPLNEEINGKLTATGFGVTVAGAITGSQTLMEVQVNIVDSIICNKSMKFLIKRMIIANGITQDQFCAGDYEHGGKDTCQGDSGGPLQLMEESVDCINSFPLHKVVGITSFGRDCGRKMAPGVYTKVYNYLEWIENTVWP